MHTREEKIMATKIDRRSYAPNPAPTTFLPFVRDIKTGRGKFKRNYWAVPDGLNYTQQCERGYQFACDYIQYIKQNPTLVGSSVMYPIVKAIFDGETEENKGYSVGFFAFIEQIVYQASVVMDHYAIADCAIQRA